MDLRDISMDDLDLYEAMATDPAMMSELGGPLPREGLKEKLQGIVDDVETGRIWYFTIIPDGHDAPAGTVCIWDHPWNGETISEIGWMVRTEFQGRGLATEAVRLTLERARQQRRWDVVHAFPGVTNGPSNAICRRAGLSMIEEVDYTGFMGVLRCNHWVIDLRIEDPS
jgi:RimJ/RimL family protein N-acetyltransferase